MRAGLSDRRADAGLAHGRRDAEACGLGRSHGGFSLSLLRRRLPGDLSGERREDRLCRRPRRSGEPQSPLRQGAFRFRLYPASAPADEAADPAAEHAQGCQRPGRSGQSLHAFPRSDMGGGARFRRWRIEAHPRSTRTKGARGLRLGERLERRSLSLPEDGAHRLRLEQCRPLHAPLPRLLGCRSHGRPELRRRYRAVFGGDGCGSHNYHRRQSGNQSSRRRDLHQASGEERRQAHRHGSAPPIAVAACMAASRFQARQRRVTAQRDAAHDHHGRADRPAVHRRLHGEFRGAEGKDHRFPAGEDGGGLRHSRRDDQRGCARLCQVPCVDHLLGHGHQPACPRHRQHALPDRACLDDGADRQTRNRTASVARAEQRAGRIRRRFIPMLYPDYQPVENKEVHDLFSEFWGQNLDPKPGLTVVEIMNAVHAGDIRGMYVEGENPAMSDPDLNPARQALAKLEHLVVQDLFVTETAFHADVILPASAFAEKVGTFTNTDRRVQMARQIVDPPGDARQDWWIIQQIARRIGLDWNYAGPHEVFAEMAQVMPSLNNITWERVEREGAVTYPVDGPDQPGNEIIFYAGFPTASGRAKIVPARVTPPDEIPDEEYPMVLSTGRVLEHWHTGSMTRRAEVLDDLEPEAVAFMSPKELRRRGLRLGDYVKLETRRGIVEVKVRSDSDVPENMVFMPFCYVEAAANLLTNPALDPFGKIPEFKFCAARVSRVEMREAAE